MEENKLQAAIDRAKERGLVSVLVTDKVFVCRDETGYFLNLDKDDYVVGIRLTNEEFTDLVEDLYAHLKLVEAIKVGIAQLDAGLGIPLEEVRKLRHE